jgi:hypothetical protein
MAGTLVYDADGKPIVTQEAIAAEAKEALVEAFGFVTGLTIARAKTEGEIETLFDEARSKIMAAVINLKLTDAVKERYGISLRVSKEGEVIADSDEALARPPGPPRARSNPYRQ